MAGPVVASELCVSMTTKPLSEAPAPTSSPITRDPRTLDLLTSLVTEAELGLRRVDEVLMASAREPITPAALNELLRVFRDLTNVSGRVDAEDVLRLSRVTETLIEATSAGRVLFRQDVLDALFEASLVMRELLEEVWSATVESRTFTSARALEATVSKLELANQPSAESAS